MRKPPEPQAHEHFCSSCFPKRTNGKARGWWRCLKVQCTKPLSSPCKKHQSVSEAGVTP